MSEFPEAWEGNPAVLARPREEWLLSLDENAIAHRDVIRAMTRHLWNAVLVGNPAPAVKRMCQRMKNPRPGDLVVESSTWYRQDIEFRHKGFGYLLSERTEWCETLEELEAWHFAEICTWENRNRNYQKPVPADRDDRPTTHIYYVQYGQEKEAVCRWENCQFVAVPSSIHFFEEPDFGSRDEDGSSVTLTRDDLIGALADSGFHLKLPGESS